MATLVHLAIFCQQMGFPLNHQTLKEQKATEDSRAPRALFGGDRIAALGVAEREGESEAPPLKRAFGGLFRGLPCRTRRRGKWVRGDEFLVGFLCEDGSG